MKAVVISGGEKPSFELLKKSVCESDIIIGADKGCECLLEYDITPKYIVGDFDSAKKNVIDSLVHKGAKKIQYQEEKDFTDSDVAVELAIDNGAKEVTLFGVTGTRLDHTFGNLGLLMKLLKKDIKGKIINDNNTIMLINKSTTLKVKEEYKYISFLAYGQCVKALSIRDAKYELSNYDLEIGDSMTVSNEFKKNEIHIEFTSGYLLVIYSKD